MPEQVDVTRTTAQIWRAHLSCGAALLRSMPVALAVLCCTGLTSAEANHVRAATVKATSAHAPSARAGARRALIRNEPAAAWMTESRTEVWPIEIGVLAAGLALLARLTWVHALPGRLKLSVRTA